MPKRREVHVRRVLPTGSENVRRRLDVEAGEGTSAQRAPPPPCTMFSCTRSYPCIASCVRTHPDDPQKHHGVLRGIRRSMGGLSELDIDGYITQMQAERDQDAMPRVHDEWSSEDDITPEEDSGDEYLPPGATGGVDLESDLDFSGFRCFEEEEEEQLLSEILTVTVMGKVRVMGQCNQGRGGGCSCAWWWCP